MMLSKILLLFASSLLTVVVLSDDVCITKECVQYAGSILSAMDLTADPCKDFYQYACGGFELRQNIPAGESSFDQFAALEKMQKKILRHSIENLEEDDESLPLQKMKRYYKSCIDETTVDLEAVPGLQQMLDRLGGLYYNPDIDVPSNWSLNRALTTFDNFSSGAFFDLNIGEDDKDVSHNIMKLDQGSLTLGWGARDYYLNKSVTSDPVLSGIVNLAEKYARLILGSDAVISRDLIEEIVEFEKRRAEIQLTQAELDDVLATYNKVNITWFQENLGFLDWVDYLSKFLGSANLQLRRKENIVLYGMPYFEGLSALVSEYLTKPGGKRTLQNYLAFQAISGYAPLLGGEFQAASDAFLAIAVGKRGSKERWELCLGDTDGSIGFPLGSIFVKEHMASGGKAKAEQVISNILTTFRQRIEKASWMAENTRHKALEKIDALVYDVAYPGWLFNSTYMNYRYESLMVTDDYVQNQFAAFSYSRIREISKLRKSPDRTEWEMTPQTVNAYYSPTKNTIVLPAAILTPPMFYRTEGIPSALNYGTIGAVAGHEITHGFDNSGRQFDKYGNLKEWWDEQSSNEFQNRSRCFIRQFNGYEVGGIVVKGDQTLAENIADDGGIKVAYQAYKKFEKDAIEHGESIADKMLGLDDLTADQLFFIGFGQAWCNVQTSESTIYSVQTDVHSPNRIRVIGTLSNSKDFAEAFNCPSGTPMNPKNKCSIW